ncbi:calcium-binding protein [Phaeobacter sp.]|uniref:calcium-binding protein n=1 Tax=Phaeobacter sp. TaxID=1902409 RepID=UPI0025D57FDC|nr:calcium-binding protein [Phaeobacter sp.]
MTDVTVPAAANTAPPLDFSTFDFAQASVLFADGTTVVLRHNDHVLRFTGSFAFDDQGNLTADSMLQGFELFFGQTLLMAASGFQLTTAQILTDSFADLMAAALAGDDRYTSAWSSGEIINTFGGNDTISAGTGNDTIDGGSGFDTLLLSPAQPGYSFTFNDVRGATLNTAAGSDQLFDIERVEIGSQILALAEGGAGNDSLISTNLNTPATRDMIHGRGGNDQIIGGAGQDHLLGGDGADSLNGGANHDLLLGGFGDDHLRGGAGRDNLRGEAGNDQLDGGKGHDMLGGDRGRDTLDGGKGNDQLSGGRGSDQIKGGAGRDTLTGEGGNDRLQGQGGRDLMRGDSGRDTLQGGRGADTLFGGDGTDRLVGQAGNDRLTGGSQADTFVFARGHGADTITDFTIGTDLIQILSGADSITQLGFATLGDDVRISFADVTVVVENVSLTALMEAENFQF